MDLRDLELKDWTLDVYSLLECEEDVLDDISNGDYTIYVDDAISEVADYWTPDYNAEVWENALTLSSYIEQAIEEFGVPTKVDLVKIFQQGYYFYFRELMHHNKLEILWNFTVNYINSKGYVLTDDSLNYLEYIILSDDIDSFQTLIDDIEFMVKLDNVREEYNYDFTMSREYQNEILEQFKEFSGYIGDAISEIGSHMPDNPMEHIVDISEWITESTFQMGMPDADNGYEMITRLVDYGFHTYNTQILYNNLDALIKNYVVHYIIENDMGNNIDDDGLEDILIDISYIDNNNSISDIDEIIKENTRLYL